MDTEGLTMPYGKYQGKKIKEVPEDYLMWLYEHGKCNWEVRSYIFDNIILKKEEKNQASPTN